MQTTLSQSPSFPSVEEVAVHERVARLCSRSIKKSAKVRGLKLALSMIDLTTLEGKDTEDRVRHLCAKAVHPADNMPGLPPVAAVCVYPPFVALAKKLLKNTTVKVASVATSFPSGLAPQDLRLEETRRAVETGADEIDMVISRGKFLAGEHAFVYDEIAAVKEACGSACLKVILETGELVTLENVRAASDLALKAGGDFIKTSTGKIQPAATLPVTLVMLEAVRDYFFQTGEKRGIKPAGGIASAKLALQYLVMVRETLGHAWLTPDLFRLGASKLANDILMQLKKEQSGAYQSLDYFSKD